MNTVHNPLATTHYPLARGISIYLRRNMATYPRIEQLETKLLVGNKLPMSLVADRTLELWQSFMPHRNKISHRVSTDLYCVQVYKPGLRDDNFSPADEFDKWAVAEVSAIENIPEGMETLIIPAGSYAVFLHRGTSADFKNTAAFIFGEWLPASGYRLDDRPHFEILGEKYKREHPDSEEEIWIPIAAQ